MNLVDLKDHTSPLYFVADIVPRGCCCGDCFRLMQVCGTKGVSNKNKISTEHQKLLYWKEDQYQHTVRGNQHDLLLCPKNISQQIY